MLTCPSTLEASLDGSLGQSGGRRSHAAPQEPEPGRTIGALAGAQDRCPAGIPEPLPGHKLVSGTPTWGVASFFPRLPSAALAWATMSNLQSGDKSPQETSEKPGDRDGIDPERRQRDRLQH